MNVLANLVCVTTATTGTGPITLGPKVTGLLTFAEGAITDGQVVTYYIRDGANSEVGQGTYTASGTTLSRDTVYRSTGAANTGKITLSGTARVALGPAKEDFALLANGSTGSGAIALATNPIFVTPSLDVASATSLALNGATIGTNALSVTGSVTFTLTSTDTQSVTLAGTNTSTLTTTLIALALSENFNPGGASLSTLEAILNQPNISGSSITVSNFIGNRVGLRTGAGFTGTVTSAYSHYSNDPSISGSNPFTNYTGYFQAAVTNGSGITSGTVTNIGVSVAAPTAVAASGGTVNSTGVAIALASGINAGTATNYGLRITGNGQTGGATNWAINSSSTADSTLAGTLAVNGSSIGTNGFAATGSATFTLTSTDTTSLSLAGTNTSAGTSTIACVNLSESFSPAGASLTSLYGILNQPNISGSSITISNFVSHNANLKTGAGFTGTVTTAYNFLSNNPTISGSNPFTNFTGIHHAATSNGNGNTTGTITNIGLNIAAASATAGSGGTMVNAGVQIALAGVNANAGTTTNYGLRITGNGQGGGATNWAINSSSTAASTFAGTIEHAAGLTAGSAVVAPTNATVSTPANPASRTGTAVMMGLAGSITPKATVGSGNVLITVCGDCFNATAIADGGVIQLYTGTGTAPTNGAAVTGTTRGAAVKFIQATTAEKHPFSITALATGLTLGTAYWIDVSLANITGGAATLNDITITAVEI